ncbi:MAG: TonB-dependent receptor [Porticoccaceae bacterium]
MNNHSKLLPYATLALSSVIAATAQAQVDAPSVRQLEEIVVTARRTEESLQSVPVTITAFDQNALNEKSINTTQDLQFAVPGIFLTGSGSRTNTLYSIRGQARPVVGQGSPGVLTYFNDVPLPTGASSVPQYDIGSIQVLKGPQGTLFGRNSTGGAILTYSQKPTYDFGGYVQGSVGEYDYRGTEAAVNLPLVDGKAALRLATQIQRRDGYTKNVGVGADPDQLDSQSFRASLLLEPTENISNLTVLDYHKNDATTSAAIVIRGTDFNGFPFSQVAEEQRKRGPRKTVLNAPNSREDVEQFGFTNRTDITFDAFEITNIVGYRWNDVNVISQIDGMGSITNQFAPVTLDHVLEGLQKNVNEQWTEEFQIKGDALDGKLDWLTGLFYLKSEPDGPNASATGFFGPIQNVYQFLDEESKAVYVNFGYDLSDLVEGLRLNLGARKTWDESSLCSGYGELPQIHGPSNAKISNCSVAQLEDVSKVSTKSNATTWTIGLDWQVNDDLFAYITSRKGYRAGGVNGPKFGPGLAAYQVFDPEETVDVEVGVRSDWQLGDLTGRLNVSAFRTVADDVQVASSGIQTSLMPTPCDPVSNPFIDGDCSERNDPAQSAINQNVGKTELKGLEVELHILPTDNVTLSFSGTLLDSKTKSYNPPAALAAYYPADEIPILYTAEKSATVGIRYDVPLNPELGQVILNANYFYSGDVEMITFTAPSYQITNLRADWRNIFGSAFDAGVFLRNAFDKDAIVAPAALSPAAPWGTVIYNEPRMWGLEVQYNFGAN